MMTIEQVQASVNPDLQIEGLLRTMFDVRNNLSTAVSEQLLEQELVLIPKPLAKPRGIEEQFRRAAVPMFL